MTAQISLAQLRDSDPGLSETVFGPDGAFANAPAWTCPVWYRDTWYAIRWFTPEGVILREWDCATEVPGVIPLDEVFLDLRVHSVILRLAELCAWALGQPRQGAWKVTIVEGMRDGWGVPFPMATLSNAMASTNRSSYYGFSPPGRYRAGNQKIVPAEEAYQSPEAFLAALTLALGPKIVARAKAKVNEQHPHVT